MIHLIAIIGLAVACAVWVGLQLADPEAAEHTSGRCGACGGGACKRPDGCASERE